MRTLTIFYPDPNVETTSVDGPITKAAGGTWAVTRDAAAGNSAFPSNVSAEIDVEYKESTPEYTVLRAFALFDTSSLPDATAINSATQKFKNQLLHRLHSRLHSLI